MKRKRPVGGSIYLSIKSPPPKRKRRDGGDHVGTSNGGPEVIAQDHVGTSDRGPGKTVPNPTPDPKSGKSQKSRNLEKQAAPVGHSKRSYFDKSPDVEILTPEVTQVAGPAVTDNATPPNAVWVELKAVIDEAIKAYQRSTKVIQRLGSVMQRVLDTIEVPTDRTQEVETEVVEIPSPPDAEVPSHEEVGCPEVVEAVTVEAVPTRVTTILSPPGDRNQEPEIPSLPDAEIPSPPDAEIPSPPDAEIPPPPDAGVLSHEEVGWPEVAEAVTVEAESKEISKLAKAKTRKKAFID